MLSIIDRTLPDAGIQHVARIGRKAYYHGIAAGLAEHALGQVGRKAVEHLRSATEQDMALAAHRMAIVAQRGLLDAAHGPAQPAAISISSGSGRSIPGS
jgi:hypothetical protein